MRGTGAGQVSTRARASVLRPAADRAVNLLGVGRKLLLAQLEVADGVGSGRTGEEISRASVPVPAAQPVQALLFLLELREGELAERLFLVELGEVLAAVGAKLRPLLLAGLGVEQPRALLAVNLYGALICTYY